MSLINNKVLGSFSVNSGQLIVLDPCYNQNIWCTGKLEKVYCGEWTAIANYEVYSDLDQQISQLTIKSKEYPNIVRLQKEIAPFVVGVDSGCVGFFDSQYFRYRKSFEEASEGWYNYCIRQISSSSGLGLIRHGVIAHTNGDGKYSCICYRDSTKKLHRADLIFKNVNV